MKVNWLAITLTNAKGEVTYRNFFVTNLPVTETNVAELTTAGRARWQIENGTFNVVKTTDYNLEHNFRARQKQSRCPPGDPQPARLHLSPHGRDDRRLLAIGPGRRRSADTVLLAIARADRLSPAPILARAVPDTHLPPPPPAPS
jgi:hypothetical protein